MKKNYSLSFYLFFIIYFFPLSSFAMSQYNTDTNPATMNDQQKTSVTNEDAVRAYNAGDKRVIGIMTRGLSVPSLGEYNLNQVKKVCGIKQINSADSFTSDAEFKAIKNQTDYASDYNKTMLKLCFDKMKQPI